MATKRKPATRRETKKASREELRQAEAGVKSAQETFAKILAIADPQAKKR